MSKEIILYNQDSFSFKKKFYTLIDLLITNQSSSRIECIIFVSIYYLQILCGFFSEQIGIFNKKSTSDNILYFLHKIFRLDILNHKYLEFKISIYIYLIVIILFIIYFLIVCSNIKRKSFYSYNEAIINYFIKCYLYIAYNVILDSVICNFCFGENETNPYFKGVSCKIKDNLGVIVCSIILLIISIILTFFIQFFYFDSHFLSNSYYARISCNYEIFLNINSIVYSIFLIEAKYLSKEVFLLYNSIISILFFYFYLKHYLFYDRITNTIAGMFHIIYLWTSIFSLIFAYLNFNDKGVIYLVSCIVILYLYYSLKIRIEEKIFLDTPFYKIKNKSHFLFYLKNLIDKINHIKEFPEEKAILTGIIYMHSIECPDPNCMTKNKEKIYLPMTDEWTDRSKTNIEDKVFLIHFIVMVMKYFIESNEYSPDMLMNLSFYYLEMIGNYCLSIFYFRKVKEMKLTFQEKFSLKRLKIRIAKALIEKVKYPYEMCSSIEDLNVTIYYKYSNLSEKFIDEINNDVNLSLEFWNIFQKAQLDSKKQIDFNKIFFLTNKIRISKEKIEKLWNKLLNIYNGVNDLFLLYSDYVEQINDDDLKKRDLEELKRKNDNFSEQFSQNYYSLLFNKETGIMIANGDKGKEGIIEKTNLEIEKIFKYKSNELKGRNLNILMPKIYSKIHNNFIKRYYEIGEKITIDKKNLKTFGKDKDNNIIMLRLIIKLFPILNQSVYFIGILSKENIDDIIFIDSNFYIQGASSKIIKKLKITNNLLFQENDIPFYVICKQFVNFYKIFLQGTKQNLSNESLKKQPSILIDILSKKNEEINDDENEELENKSINNKEKEKKELQENVEINENIELEYEILLPEFLLIFSESTKNKENKEKNKLNPEISNNESVTEEINNDETYDEYGESDLLVDKTIINGDNEKKKLKNLLNTPTNLPTSTITPTPDDKTPNPNITPNSYQNDINNNGINQIKTQKDSIEEESEEFNFKINKYKRLFEEKNFNKLIDYIDENNKNTLSEVFKFNFTFDRIKFGHQEMAYLIRCIDNKNDKLYSEEESNENADPIINQYKKDKADAIKPLYELLDNERKNILSQSLNFYSLSMENERFQKLLNLCRNDINKMSMVHGQKKDEIMDDENSSQTSQAGFNSDLVKKERIEEIRANLLNNISEFYTIKYIKGSIGLVFIFTIVYGIVYLFLFYNIYEDLKKVNILNVCLFQITNWTTSLIGTIVSLNALYQKVEKKLNYSFNSFIEDHEFYFYLMRLKSVSYYDNITTYFGKVEHEIGKYLNKEDHFNLFLKHEKIEFYNVDMIDEESFPTVFSQILNDVNSLLFNKYFNLNDSFPTNNAKYYFEYINYIVIENSYNNLIPNLFNKVKKIPFLFQAYISSSKKTIIITIFFYAALMVVCCFIYSFLIFFTNQKMGEGFQKVSKIKIDKIDEIMKKISDFHENLKSFFQSDFNDLTFKEKFVKTNIEATISKTHNENLNEEPSSLESNGFNTETKKPISLKVLNYAYSQSLILFLILFSFLIPNFIITNSMVNSTNKLINVENFIFGKFIVSSSKILKVKCEISECNVTNTLNVSGLVDMSNVQKIIQGISLYDDLNKFYNQYYMLDVCKAVYEDNSITMELCLNDTLIKSANSTESLLKLIDEIVESLEKDIEIYNGENYTLLSGDIVEFKNYYLYESNLFYNLESIFYKYVCLITNNFAEIFITSSFNYLEKKRNSVVVLTSTFLVIIMALCFYFSFFFIKKLICLICVSRCILKIIPTSVITNTQELENWMEENKI